MKVIEIAEGGSKVRLSMKYADQQDGEDLDPEQKQLTAENRTQQQQPRGGGGGGSSQQAGEEIPELFSIHKGAVAKIEAYGCFVSIQGFRKQGLVHVSHLTDTRVEDVNECVSVGDDVFVKVIGVDVDSTGGDRRGAKISLSMKYVAQGSGEDLDPGHANASADSVRRSSGPGGKRKRQEILVGDALDPMATMAILKKMASTKKGHVDNGVYGLVSSSDEEDSKADVHKRARAPPPAKPMGRGRGSTLPAWMTDPDMGKDSSTGPKAHKKSKKKHKHKKEKKHKREKKR